MLPALARRELANSRTLAAKPSASVALSVMTTKPEATGSAVIASVTVAACGCCRLGNGNLVKSTVMKAVSDVRRRPYPWPASGTVAER
jgi:hypothetical protein